MKESIKNLGFKLQHEIEKERFIYTSDVPYQRGNGNYCLYYNPTQDWVLIWVGKLPFGTYVIKDNSEFTATSNTVFAGKIKNEDELKTILGFVGYEIPQNK
jgi:hypothetical protein